MPVTPAPNSPPPANHNFEHALERLETIVQRMEADRLPLEELLACYEEGTRLVKVCGEFLAVAEQRIELIARDAAGEPKAVPFNDANVARLAPAVPANPSSSSSPAPHANGGPRRPRPAAAATVSPSASEPAAPTHEVSLF